MPWTPAEEEKTSGGFFGIGAAEKKTTGWTPAVEPEETVQKPSGIFGELGKGAVSGAMILPKAAGDIIEYVPKALGLPEVPNPADLIYNDLHRGEKQPVAGLGRTVSQYWGDKQKNYAPAVARIEDIHNMGDFGKWAAWNVGQMGAQVASIVPFMAMGGGAGAVPLGAGFFGKLATARTLAAGAEPAIGGLTALKALVQRQPGAAGQFGKFLGEWASPKAMDIPIAAMESEQILGGQLERDRQGEKDAINPTRALAAVFVATKLEELGAENAINNLFSGSLKRAPGLAALMKTVGTRALAVGTGEGTEEFFQTYAEQFGVDPSDLASKDMFMQAVNGAASGFVGGMFLGGGGATLTPVEKKVATDPTHNEINKQLKELDPDGQINVKPSDDMTSLGAPLEGQASLLPNEDVNVSDTDKLLKAIRSEVDFTTEDLSDKGKYPLQKLGDLEVKYAGQPEETIFRDEIRRRSEGAGGTQLKTITRERELSYQEEVDLRRKYGKDFKRPMETVKLPLAEAAAYEKKQAELKVVAEQEAEANKAAGLKEYAEENTKFRKKMETLPSDSALRQVLELIHEKGIKTSEVESQDVRFQGGKNRLETRTRQLLPGNDATTTDELRNILTKFGFPKNKGINKNGYYDLDTLADELNNKGNEGPPNMPGIENTGRWDAEHLKYLLIHAPTEGTKTAESDQVAHLQAKYQDEEDVRNTRIAELEAIPDDERSAAQHEELFDLTNPPIADFEGTEFNADEFAEGEAPFKASTLYGKVNKLLGDLYKRRETLKALAERTTSPELRAIAQKEYDANEARIKENLKKQGQLTGAIPAETKELGLNNTKEDRGVRDLFVLMGSYGSQKFTPDQVVSAYEKKTGKAFRFNWLLPLLRKFKVEISFDYKGEKLNDDDYGQFDSINGKNLITFGAPSLYATNEDGFDPKFVETFAHESIHAILWNALEKVNSLAAARMHSQLKVFATSLLEHADSAPQNIQNILNLRNYREVLTYGLTNKDFAAWLHNIKASAGVVKAESGTMWDRFKKIILDYIGGESKAEATKLDELSSLMDDHLGISGITEKMIETLEPKLSKQFTKEDQGKLFKHSAFHGGRDVRKSKEGKLSLKHAGTGTGGTAQGHGLYFADLRQVSEYYRDLINRQGDQYDNLSGLIDNIVDDVRMDIKDEAPHLIIGGPQHGQMTKRRKASPLDEYIAPYSKQELEFLTSSGELPAELNTEKVLDTVKAIVKVRYLDSSSDMEVHEAQRSFENLVKLANSYIKTKPEGVLYKVELAPKPEDYLLWDEPLSRQSEKVKQALERSEYKDYIFGKKSIPLASYLSALNDTGATIYRTLATAIGHENSLKSNGAIRNEPDEKAASEHLHSLGIRGNKYLDANSRGINTAGPTIVAYYESGEGKVPVGYGKTIEEARENTDPNWFKHKNVIEIKFETQARPKPTYNYVIFSEEDVEITEIFTSIKNRDGKPVDKRELAVGIYEGKLNQEEVEYYEAQMATRLMSLGKKEDFVPTTDKKTTLFRQTLKKIGALYERTIGTDRDRGFYNLPQVRERHERAVETQKSAIHGAGAQQFNLKLVEAIAKERLTRETIEGLLFESKALSVRKKELLTAMRSLQRQGKEAVDYATAGEVTKINVRLKEIPKTIDKLKASIKPTIEIDPKGYKTEKFAEANELARQNGYELIPIKERTGCYNAFINRTTKQIFSEVGGLTSVFNLIGHELSHVGVKGHASNKETQMFIDTTTAAFVQYKGELGRLLGRKVSEAFALEEYAADLQGGIKENFGVTLADGLHTGAKVDVISKTAEYEGIEVQEGTQKVGVTSKDVNVLEEALSGEIKIGLKNGLISMKQNMKPFLKNASQEVRDIYNGLNDFREFAYKALTNPAFAGWLHSVVDYSSRWKGEKASFRMIANPSTGKEEPVRRETVWNSLERKMIGQIGTRTLARTKLDALTDLLNKELPNAFTASTGEEEMAEASLKYKTADDFINDVSYVPTNKTKTVTFGPAKTEVQVRIFENKKGQQWQEPVIFKNANANTVGTATYDDFKAIYRDLYKKGWHNPSMYLRNSGLRRIWETAHGIPQQQKREAINKAYAEQVEKNKQTPSRSVMPKAEGGVPLTRKELTISKAAAGFSVSTRKMTAEERQEEQRAYVEDFGIASLPRELQRGAKALINIEFGSTRYGSRDTVNNALWGAIVKIYAGNASAGKLAQETFDEVQIAVKEELELIDKPLNIKPTEEADINAWIEEEGRRAAQKMAIDYQKQMAKQGWSYGNPQEVTEPIVRKEAPFKAPATLESNEKILRKMSASGKTSEVGSIVIDVFEDYIQLTKLNLTRKSNAAGAIASLFKENKGAETIRLDVDTSTARKDQERFVELARILTAFGAKLNFKAEGGSEYVLSRDDFGKSIENLEEAKDEGLPTTPAQIKKQARMKMASFGELEDSFNPDEDADVIDAIFTSVKAGPVTLPTTPRELNMIIKGDWINNQSAMPAETHKNMMNVISQYGGLKWSKVRELLSLPYQNAKKFVDWARVYHVLGEERVEARDKLVYEWMSIANKFLNRRKIFKEAGYTRAQRKDAEYRIGRVITIGDENLRNDLFDLREQIKEIDQKLNEPLLHDASALQKEKVGIEDKIAQIQTDKAYSFEQVQAGITDEDGSKVKLNQLEYDMYRSVRAAEDSIFERILSHMRDTLYNQYRGQKWFKLLAASLGEDISQEDAQKIVGNLKEASDPKKISVKLKDIFKRINNEFEKVPDKEAKDVLSKYEKISSTISSELKELRDYMANVYGIKPERDLFGAKSYPQLDQAIKEMFVAYQRTRPQLKKIRDLRNTWGEWPGFFPRQREKGDIKMQMYERIPNAETGALEEKEVYSAHFSTDAEAQNVYAHIMEKFGTDGVLDERYDFKYPPVSKTEENSFDGLRDFNLQALIENAFEGMQAKGGYFDENGNPINIKDEIWGSALEAIAGQFQKRGAAAHGIPRKQAFGEKAIKGYLEKDHAQILISHITAMAGLLTKQDAAQNVMEVMSDLEDKTLGPELRKYIKGQLRNDSNLDRLSSKARSFAFVWYLGAMIKSATVNSTQPYIVGLPVMAAYMRSKGIKGSATITQLNASRTIAQNGGMLFKDPSEWGGLPGIDAKQRRYLTEGVVGGSMAAQAIRFIKGQTSGWGRVWNQTFDVLATPFAMVERFNRMTSGLAMFNIAYDHYQSIKSKEESDEDVFEKAMKDANTFINDVHYPIGKHNLPIPAQGGDPASISIKTLYVFRTFNHNFLLNQFNFLRSAIRLRTAEGRSDPEIRAQATNDLKTFIHTMALVAMFGGMMGLPFLKDLFDWYEKQFGYSPKQWVRQTLRGVGGQTLETMGMGGLPAVLGGNISGSLAIGVPFMGTNTDSIYGVWGGLKEKGKKAAEAAKRGDYYRVATNVSPEFVRNPIVALTESDFGRQTLGTRGFATTPQGLPSYASSGKPLSLTGGEALWKAAGFQPTRYAREREVEQSVKVQILWAKEQKKNISETLKIDRLQNDPNAMKTMMTSVNKLNKKIRENKIPEPPAVMSRIIQASRATKNLQKRRELSRRNELLE